VIVAEDAAARSAERARDSRGTPPAVTPPTDSLTGIVDAMAAAGVPVNEWLGAAGLGSATVRGVDANTRARDSSTGDVNAEARNINLAAARDLPDGGSSLDASLLLVSQLLVLREQIAPFDGAAAPAALLPVRHPLPSRSTP